MRNLILLVVLIAVSASAHAQNRNKKNQKKKVRTSLFFGGNLEIPVGEFAEFRNEPIIGFGGNIISRTKFPFLKSGVHFTYGRLDKFSDEIYVHQGETYNGLEVVEQANLKVKNKIYRTHGSLRLQPFKKNFQPYFEVAAGLKYFSTSATSYQGTGREKIILNRENIEGSVTTSYGWAAGAKFKLAKRFYAEVRYEHLTGGRASIVDPDSFSLNKNDQFEYNLASTKTNSSLIHLGITLDF